MGDRAALFDLTGRRSVVVGAGSGIGRASAVALASLGSGVVCADLDLDAARRTAAGLSGSAAAERLDMTVAEDCLGVAQGHEADVVVIAPGVNVRRVLLDSTDEDFDLVIGLNLKGTYRLMREFGRAMAGRGRGSIIALTSIRASVVEPGQGLYGAAKAGVQILVQALGEELGERGVRVNAVAPGPVETPLTQPIRDIPDWYEAYRAKPMLKRWAQPEEIAGAVAFLATDASSYVTGSVLHVDGGWLGADGRFRPPPA